MPLIFDQDDFNAIANNYLDTLHSDYAFVISTTSVKSASSALEAEEETDGMGWDFTLYPNPAKDELFLRLPDDAPKEIVLHDLAGRQIHAWSSVVGPVLRLPLGHLATGVYAVRVFNGATSRTKKLIIH
ncbi:MAG: T9SS type A sorting domain-containing protein [Flavobacteriales bacterium]|nr:T9SS type A sorting domain-containing protein [Flavobacteriales bacterium]